MVLVVFKMYALISSSVCTLGPGSSSPESNTPCMAFAAQISLIRLTACTATSMSVELVNQPGSMRGWTAVSFDCMVTVPRESGAAIQTEVDA